ncbi:hypothetical protein Q0Z83_073920 [Actinoplanes sichuanensis]|uniref:Uncharacterized protein n=1 Tax=Actinoplanes sichuanensis TaxID=512349 RepID=A0ABW4A880_9ACTN|nr:hypothetical protein [Actinoplanes sichuanensis]BEL09201.1 hypothetical protein Q0Z83_073920 [Actinoplanes sichuanensis]
MGRDLWPKHGRRRIWWAPWRVVCRCGLAAYPCVVLRTVYRNRVDAAQRWRNEERRNAHRW